MDPRNVASKVNFHLLPDDEVGFLVTSHPGQISQGYTGGPRIHGLAWQRRRSSGCGRWWSERYSCSGLQLGPLDHTEWVAGPGSPCWPPPPTTPDTSTSGILILSHGHLFPFFFTFTSPELYTSVTHKWHLPNIIDKLFCQEKKGPVKANRWARTQPFPAVI